MIKSFYLYIQSLKSRRKLVHVEREEKNDLTAANKSKQEAEADDIFAGKITFQFENVKKV